MTAPPDMDERLIDEALAWHQALETDDADWDGYTLWLEADPRHRAAFNEIALTNRIVDVHRLHLRATLPEAAVAAVPSRSPQRWWLAGAAAAAAAVAAVALPLAMRPADDVTYATAARSRHIALPSGITIDLAPASTLIVKGGDTSRLELAGGEAFFDVAHDPRRSLSIKAGNSSVSDIGTRFAINLTAETMLVGVADGQVRVDPAGSNPPIHVAAGEQLSVAQSSGKPSVGAVDSADIGSWRRGRLSYSNAPLEVVAADISRYLGKTVTMEAGIGDRRFSGVLTIGDGSKLLPTLSQIMALSYTVDGDHIRIGAATAR
ncbi:FecR family protein [Sphingomonas sp. GB1N7]|uniref:FecR family protein n=1 Tax=Parasphingomonas caseinilytica TaxID=3096158 RepID=UPI002FC5AD6A